MTPWFHFIGGFIIWDGRPPVTTGVRPSAPSDWLCYAVLSVLFCSVLFSLELRGSLSYLRTGRNPMLLPVLLGLREAALQSSA